MSPAVAVAARSDDSTVLVRRGVPPDRWPAALTALMESPRCDSRDEPLELAGLWLGIVGTDGIEARPAPPYRLEPHVESSSAPRYERAFLTVRVPPELGRPLGRAGLRTSLWEGGTLSLVVRCDGGRHVAERVEVPPPR